MAEKFHSSQRFAEAGHWEADLVICRRTRQVLVLHEQRMRLNLMERLMGETATESVSNMTAVLACSWT